jgi:hypothetical protein
MRKTTRTFLPHFAKAIFKAPLKGLCQQPKIRLLHIVQHAVAPYETNIIGAFRRREVLLALQLALDGPQVHHLLDDLGVVIQTQTTPIHGLSKRSNVRPGQERVHYLCQPLQRLDLRWVRWTGHRGRANGFHFNATRIVLVASY